MVSDDHGRQMGCYGDADARTDNLDALARDGIVMDRAYCTASTCAPSRAVILTGLHNHTNGMYGLEHRPHHFHCFDDLTSLPNLLNEAGYRTGRIGKYHVAPEPVFHFQQVLDAGNPCGRDDVKMSDLCRDFIAADGPFFLYWASYNPHRGGGTLDSHPLKPDRFGNPDESFSGDTEETFDEASLSIPDFLSDTPEVRAELAQYHQSVARMDRGAGRLIDLLRQAGKYDNTVILYLSDNGPAFPESKTTLYEAGMNLPLIVKPPADEAIPTGRSEAMVSWVDLAPTLLDYAGVDVSADRFHGRSFRPVLGADDLSAWPQEVYASHSLHQITNYYPMRVIRTDQWKFIWNIAHPLSYPFASDIWTSATWQGVLRDGLEQFGPRSIEAYQHRPRFELYDMQADPLETTNLADRPEHAGLIDEFCRKLRDFQQQTRDPWLHKWEYE
jgi:N-sulfoglucosamine sulfohydrolase